MHFATVHNAEDQEELLKNILETKNKIRTQREKKRLEKEKLNLKYGMLINPITKQIESIIKKPVVPAPEPESEPQPEPELNEPTEQEAITANSSSEVLQPYEESGYQKALDSVGEENHDEGFLGIDPKTNTIHGMPFTVHKNELIVSTKNGEVRIPNIKPNTWKILIAKHPDRLNVPLHQRNSNLPSAEVKQYRHIANTLDLLNRTNQKIDGDTAPREIVDSNKYKILSKKAKSSSAAKNVEIIPSDPRNLLRKLTILAGEYRAGNEDVLSSITPMLQEARRIGIAEKDLKFLDGIPTTQVLR